jgi:Beta-ketoacyl synthase, N-terminal domain
VTEARGEQQLAIAGLGLWFPGCPSTASWISGVRDPAALKPRGLALDRVNRRRASLVGRALADVAAEAMEQARADPATISTVIGSSLGEAATMIGLLEQMWRLRTPMSPAAFTMSVHNAASGLISISNGNRGFTTSLAADDDTPAAALLEAAGLVAATGGPVLVACADEVAPVDLVPDDQRFDLLAAAVVLAPAAATATATVNAHVGSPSCRAWIRLVLGGEPDVPPAELAPELARHPQAGLFDLVAAVLRGASGLVRLDRGGGSGWCAEIRGCTGLDAR